MPQAAQNPCQTCGACCRSYRVSFYWAEALENGLDERWYERVGPLTACMRGTWHQQPCCEALQGELGQSAHCTVYAARPSVCREVQAGDPQCRQARLRHGLPEWPEGLGPLRAG